VFVLACWCAVGLLGYWYVVGVLECWWGVGVLDCGCVVGVLECWCVVGLFGLLVFWVLLNASAAAAKIKIQYKNNTTKNTTNTKAIQDTTQKHCRKDKHKQYKNTTNKKMIRQELFFPKTLNRSLYMDIISFLLIG
jgi:hypothetical protein